MNGGASSSVSSRGIGTGLLVSLAVLGLALLAPQWIGSEGAYKLHLFVPFTAMTAINLLIALWCIFTTERSIGRLVGRSSGEELLFDPRFRRTLWAACFVTLWLLLWHDFDLGGKNGRDAIADIGTVINGGKPTLQCIAGATNALALTTVMVLMCAAFLVVRSAAALPERAAKALPMLATCQRAVVDLLQAGTAFAFVSTTSLFLFFALADEVRNEKAGSKSTTTAVECVARPRGLVAGPWDLACTFPSSPDRAEVKGLEAASMAFGVGVSFAAVLFVSLFTAGRSVDHAISRVEDVARRAARWKRVSFSGPEWRKSLGLPESGLTQSIVQAVLLFAPTAAAGLAVLLKS